jgi:ketosteroid isomerase-like protein
MEGGSVKSEHVKHVVDKAPVTRPGARKLMATAALSGLAGSLHAATPDAAELVARLDTDFQAAVKHNDERTMARILHPQMVLVLGNGEVATREEQLEEARSKLVTYERQEEDPGTQTVRVFGDTAVVTARLWIKGSRQGESFERRLWFSDTYIRVGSAWQYVFGQASTHLPDAAARP